MIINNFINKNFTYNLKKIYIIGEDFSKFNKFFYLRYTRKSLLEKKRMICDGQYLVGKFVISKLLSKLQKNIPSKFLNDLKYHYYKRSSIINLNISHKDNFAIGVGCKNKNINLGIDIEKISNGLSLHSCKRFFSSEDEFIKINNIIDNVELTSTLILLKRVYSKILKTFKKCLKFNKFKLITNIDIIRKKFLVKNISNKLFYDLIFHKDYVICISYSCFK